MAVFTLTNLHVAMNSLNLSCFANQVDVAAEADELDVTTFCGGGYRQKITGLASFTVAPTGDTVGNIAYFGNSRATTMNELTGAVGEVAAFTLNTAGVSRLVRGVMLHPVLARTATGTGTAVAFTTPLATQGLYASFHVHSVTGTGTVVLNVQTDDNAGFTTGISRITSSSFTAPGHELKSVVGALVGETHIRASWTITGFTSVTFSIAAGVS